MFDAIHDDDDDGNAHSADDIDATYIGRHDHGWRHWCAITFIDLIDNVHDVPAQFALVCMCNDKNMVHTAGNELRLSRLCIN